MALLIIAILFGTIAGSILIGMAINSLTDELRNVRVKLAELNSQIERARYGRH